MSSSHFTSHNARETDAASEASTRTGYGGRFSVTVPPRAADAALRGGGRGGPPLPRPQDRRPPGGWAGGREGCATAARTYRNQEAPGLGRCDDARKGSLVPTISATRSRVRELDFPPLPG